MGVKEVTSTKWFGTIHLKRISSVISAKWTLRLSNTRKWTIASGALNHEWQLPLSMYRKRLKDKGTA